MPNILDRLRKFIAQHGLPAPGSPVLVAVSGGPDSVALLLLLAELGYKLTVAHCNFGLRAEAHDEETWVLALAGRLGIQAHVRRFDTADFAHHAGEGTQQAARKLRYAFFEQVMAEQGIEVRL